MRIPSDFVAVDPLALIFTGEDYIRIVEGLHPHVPKVLVIQEVLRSMSSEERAFTLTRARAMVAYGRAIEEAAATFE